MDENYSPVMPDVDAPYLLNYLFEIGPVVAAGFGAGKITNLELQAWQENVGVDLSAWEARIIRRLSGDYLAESTRAHRADCPAPWDCDAVGAKLASKNMRDSIKGMTKL